MDLAEEIVAFANSEVGEIWLGVIDDGNLTGLSRSYEEGVMGICRAACIPAIQPQKLLTIRTAFSGSCSSMPQ